MSYFLVALSAFLKGKGEEVFTKVASPLLEKRSKVRFKMVPLGNLCWTLIHKVLLIHSKKPTAFVIQPPPAVLSYSSTICLTFVSFGYDHLGSIGTFLCKRDYKTAPFQFWTHCIRVKWSYLKFYRVKNLHGSYSLPASKLMRNSDLGRKNLSLLVDSIK